VTLYDAFDETVRLYSESWLLSGIQQVWTSLFLYKFDWMEVLHGDLGQSILNKTSVSEM
jgi:hypothetical protein